MPHFLIAPVTIAAGPRSRSFAPGQVDPNELVAGKPLSSYLRADLLVQRPAAAAATPVARAAEQAAIDAELKDAAARQAALAHAPADPTKE